MSLSVHVVLCGPCGLRVRKLLQFLRTSDFGLRTDLFGCGLRPRCVLCGWASLPLPPENSPRQRPNPPTPTNDDRFGLQSKQGPDQSGVFNLISFGAHRRLNGSLHLLHLLAVPKPRRRPVPLFPPFPPNASSSHLPTLRLCRAPSLERNDNASYLRLLAWSSVFGLV